MPKEYKQITQKGVKKFNAKESFINDKELQREYENRSYASQQLLVQRQKQEQGMIVTKPLEELCDNVSIKNQVSEIKFTQA